MWIFIREALMDSVFSYIQYETNLLELIRIRRETAGYQHKKGKIDKVAQIPINIKKLHHLVKLEPSYKVSFSFDLCLLCTTRKLH
jgi:U3 small nucleolar RNA-associated protein 6